MSSNFRHHLLSLSLLVGIAAPWAAFAQDHATPAAFYAHQKTRKNYYQIGVELANSGFEYFAGGEFQKVNGDGAGPNNHEVAAQAGYNVVTTQAGAAALTAGAGKTLIIAENLADGKAMNYAMDAAAGEIPVLSGIPP